MAIRIAKQCLAVRETQNGEEGEEEGAEFGEEDLFHQQVRAPGNTLGHVHMHTYKHMHNPWPLAPPRPYTALHGPAV